MNKCDICNGDLSDYYHEGFRGTKEYIGNPIFLESDTRKWYCSSCYSNLLQELNPDVPKWKCVLEQVKNKPNGQVIRHKDKK